MRKIKFTHTGSSAIVGNFSADETLVCTEAMGRHFVEEARCAVWDDLEPTPAPAPAPAEAAPQPAPTPAPRRARRTAPQEDNAS